MAERKVKYTESSDYIPKSIRKQCGIGEYSGKTKRTMGTARTARRSGRK